MSGTRSAGRKRGSQKLRPLTATEKADCEAFARWNDEANKILEDAGEKKFTFRDWQALTGVAENTVQAYARGERPMKLCVQLDAAERWRQTPQTIFPSWKWPNLTAIAPDDPVVRLLMSMRPPERAEALWLLGAYSSKSMRAKVLREVRRIMSPHTARAMLAKPKRG
jgi:hypothetical protein